MADPQPQIGPSDVIDWLKRELLRRFWPLALVLVIVNAVAIGTAYPLLKYVFRDYLEQQLKAAKGKIDDIRIESASAQREANGAVASANSATSLANQVNKDAIDLRSKVAELGPILSGLKRNADELPGLDLRLAELRRDVVAFEEVSAQLKIWQASLVPVGTAVPYFGDPAKIPPGWTLCDGKVLDATTGFKRDGVARELWGKSVPNLSGRLVRGRTANEEVGNAGGSDTIASHNTKSGGLHTHSFDDPTRAIQGFTGHISTQGGEWPGSRNTYSVTDPFGNHQAGANIAAITDKADQRERATGQHRHIFADGDASAKSAGAIQTKVDEGSHSHDIDALPFAPSYVASEFILRIK
jgi:hypothetical protein